MFVSGIDELLAAPKIITFLIKSLPKLHEPGPLNANTLTNVNKFALRCRFLLI